MDFGLTDEQELIRRTAREFTDNEVIPAAKENSRNHHFDLDLVRKIADQGYLGAIIPREYGGAGLDYRTYGLVVEEVGRGDSAMRTVSALSSLRDSASFPRPPRARRHRRARTLPAPPRAGRTDRSFPAGNSP